MIVARGTVRQKEVALRIALGASRLRLVRQFLIEAGTLTGVGGVVGVAIGTAMALGVSKLIKFPFVFSLPWTVIALAFSILVGVGFGLYPARRAGDMDHELPRRWRSRRDPVRPSERC